MSDPSQRGNLDRRMLLKASACMAGAAAFGVPLDLAWAAAEAGAVEQMRGSATAEIDGKRRELRPKETVYFGDMISTGARSLLVMQLGPRTTLKLGAEAKVRIDSYMTDAGGVFDLVSGPLMFDRSGPKAAGDIQFRNAYGLIAVRGTRFYAGMSRGRFAVLVGTGRVDVTGGGKTVSLGPQQGTDFVRPGAAPSAAATWSPGRAREMVAQFK